MGFKVPEGVDYIAVNHASWDTLADLHYNDENDWYKICLLYTSPSPRDS